MPPMTSDEFDHVRDRRELRDVMATGYAPSGERGTPEHARNVADALSYADGDIYYDYEVGVSDPAGFAAAAATSANVSALQTATAYARDVFEALADDPELLARVQQAVEARAGNRPGP